jgi:transcriptional regulator with XRE-family HTH domain
MDAQDLGVRELGRMADVGPGTISRILTESRGPGPEVCQKLARALKIPETVVFEQAGLLSPPRPGTEVTLRELYALLQDLPVEEQRAILDEARERWKSVHRGSAPEPSAS